MEVYVVAIIVLVCISSISLLVLFRIDRESISKGMVGVVILGWGIAVVATACYHLFAIS